MRTKNSQSISMPPFILALILIISVTKALELDIHLKLETSSCLFQTALEANQNLHTQSSTEQISFHNTLPHVTLYLTKFDDESIDQLMDTLKHLKLAEQVIEIEIDGVNANGAYAMYHILNHDSIQSLSDTIVESTKSFITPNQHVPEWVYDLPEPRRSRKIEYVEEYGSPNVFDEFQPHITVGYDDDDGTSSKIERRKILWDTLDSDGSCKHDAVGTVGVGVVGERGTVVYELMVIHLNSDDGRDQSQHQWHDHATPVLVRKNTEEDDALEPAAQIEYSIMEEK
jgi:hypothetical protein